MDLPILYEDYVLLVIDKPPGIVVNRAESVKEETVQDWVEKKSTNPPAGEAGLQIYKSTNENKDFRDRSGIVHRIDKETSGILLIAKTPESFRELQRQFKEREVKKTYLALVHGKLVPEEGEIRAPVGRLPWSPERFGIVPGGKEAVTRYKAVKSQKSKVKSEDISLVELYPETGRTHQIRVHLKYINHPIVGDYLYAGRKVGRSDRAWAPRVMLHAWKISLTHPVTRKMLAIEAPIPDDMKRIIGESTNDKSTNI
ncbi:RluA family pseudouridine synthase [Candidatus Gottesmanbacteria bacterium]|nr:RluA family pseudouridine synthase [Candidatus Gottesmanbacteria bacterium]